MQNQKILALTIVALIIAIVSIICSIYFASHISTKLEVATSQVQELTSRIEETSGTLDVVTDVLSSMLGVSKEELLAKAKVLAEKMREEKLLIERAKAEGRVVIYTSVDERTIKALKDGFEKKYPFITLEYVRGGPDALAYRFTEEFDRGVKYADVLSLGTLSSLKMILTKPERLMVYVPKDIAWLPVELRDPEGRWHSSRVVLVSIAYNTRLIKPEEAPRTFKDLIDPKWRGKIAYADFRVMAYAVEQLATFEKIYGESFIYELAKQKVFFIGTSFTDPLARVVMGEYLLTTPPITFAEVRKLAGDPVDWVRTADNTYLATFSWEGIASNAPHPNAAKLFIDFLFSIEGQAILERAGHTPLHPDVIFSNPDMSPKGKKIIFIDYLPPEKLSMYREKYKAIFFGS
jgi:iron(III) transport system substrate-binding protein